MIGFRQQSIHLREKSIVSPTERSKTHMRFLASREGLTLFDEDDVCAGLSNSVAACLNCYLSAAVLLKPRRFIDSKHDIHILDRRAGSSLPAPDK